MIGSSVVPGLPNRCVMPSSFRSARKAERPVMRFMEAILGGASVATGRHRLRRAAAPEKLWRVRSQNGAGYDALPREPPAPSPVEAWGPETARFSPHAGPVERILAVSSRSPEDRLQDAYPDRSARQRQHGRHLPLALSAAAGGGAGQDSRHARELRYVPAVHADVDHARGIRQWRIGPERLAAPRLPLMPQPARRLRSRVTGYSGLTRVGAGTIGPAVCPSASNRASRRPSAS